MKLDRPLPLSFVGAVLLSVCSLLVLLIAHEPLTGMFALKFLSGSAIAGLLLGGLVSLYLICRRNERLQGYETAIHVFPIPLILGALGVGALVLEHPPAEDRQFITTMLAISWSWWLLVLLGGVAVWRERRWGEILQTVFVTIPFALFIAALIGWMYWDLVAWRPPSNSLWHGWNGLRIVALTILAPISCFGLFVALAKGEGGCIQIIGLFAIALMAGAALGEWLLRPIGWPVTGAFVGGAIGSAAMFGALALLARRWDSKQAPVPLQSPGSHLENPTASAFQRKKTE